MFGERLRKGNRPRGVGYLWVDAFWSFAGRMWRRRWGVVCALLFATVSAGGLGAGLLGVIPILENVLGDADERRDLSDFATDLNDRLGGWGVRIPATWIEALPEGPFNAVLWIVVGLGVLTLIGAVANFLHQYCALAVVARTVADVRRDAFRKVVHLPLKTAFRAGAGGGGGDQSDLISRVVYDTTTLAQGLNALLSKAVAQVTKGAAGAAAAFLINWRLALAAMVAAPLLAIVLRKVGKRIRRASRSALQAQAGLYARTSETLGALRVVKTNTAERTECGRFHRYNKEVVRQEMRVRTMRALASPLVELIAVFVLGVLWLVAAKAVIDGDLSASELLGTLGALGVAAASLKPLTGFLNDVQQSSAAASRLRELLGFTEEPGHGHKLPKLGRHKGSVRFENVSVTYPGSSEPAVNGVTLEVPHGQTWAFVGPNGSGKTTLLSLVPRLLDPDAGGRVLIDGVDLREVSVRSVRRQVGVVTQEVVLFAGTIGWNIAYGAEGLGTSAQSEQRVREAARKARAEAFILEKDKGYQTQVGEGGAGLSGGQRQRIAIARAILKDPSILILDEATSMIDSESEAKIGEALGEFGEGRTVLVVAHRLSTVVGADRIVVLDRGGVVDQGTHAELLQRCDVYRGLVRNQMFGGEDDKGSVLRDEGGASERRHHA